MIRQYLKALVVINILLCFSCNNLEVFNSGDKLTIDLRHDGDISEYAESDQEVTKEEDLYRYIKLIDGYKMSNEKDLKSEKNFKDELSNLMNSKFLLAEIEFSNDDVLHNLAKELRQSAINMQSKNFPILRKKWGEVLKKNLSEDNIEVSISDERNSALTLTGDYFIKNKNREEFMEKLSDLLHELRFKKVIYKWYKYDDTYTIYKLKTKDDYEI